MDLNQQYFVTFLDDFVYNVQNLVRFPNIFLLTWHHVFILVIMYCRCKSSVDKHDVHQIYDTTHHIHKNIAAINSTAAQTTFVIYIIQEIVLTIMYRMLEREMFCHVSVFHVLMMSVKF